MSNVVIRAYEPKDRASIRHICCETADNGQPIERIFPNRDLIADFWTLYYIDYEPQSLWVAEKNGKVVGYLTGCLDEGRHRRVWLSKVLPRIIFTHIFRSAFWNVGLLNYFWSNLVAGFQYHKGTNLPHRSSLGHLHINLLPEARGERAGQGLMEKFKSQGKEVGVDYLRVAVREDNSSGRQFFEKMGFVSVGRRFGFRVPGTHPKDYFVVVYDCCL